MKDAEIEILKQQVEELNPVWGNMENIDHYSSKFCPGRALESFRKKLKGITDAEERRCYAHWYYAQLIEQLNHLNDSATSRMNKNYNPRHDAVVKRVLRETYHYSKRVLRVIPPHKPGAEPVSEYEISLFRHRHYNAIEKYRELFCFLFNEEAADALVSPLLMYESECHNRQELDYARLLLATIGKKFARKTSAGYMEVLKFMIYVNMKSYEAYSFCENLLFRHWQGKPLKQTLMTLELLHFEVYTSPEMRAAKQFTPRSSTMKKQLLYLLEQEVGLCKEQMKKDEGMPELMRVCLS